tara:strand:- start:629 stop:1066 length:438 start_codon:yes stop_codon:yes gene_type:complete
MKYGSETKTVEAFLQHLKRMPPEKWDAAWAAARAAAQGAGAGAAAWYAAGDAARDAAKAAAGAANEIQGAALMRERGQPFYFLPLFGFADPEAVLAADRKPSTHGDGCWTLGPQHYDCALREIARQREVIEKWREAHIEATGTDQ